MEELTPEDVDIHIQAIAHIRYLVVTEGGVTAKERIPLHIWNMPDDDLSKKWFMAQLVRRVKRKVHRLKDKKYLGPAKVLMMKKEAKSE